MKPAMSSLLICAAMISTLSLAQTPDEHASHHPQGSPAPGAPAPDSDTQPQSAPDANAVTQAMKRLQDLMSRIESASDPAERAGLLHEHMMAMLEQIKLARSMKMAMMGATQAASADSAAGKAAAPSQQPGSDKAAGMMRGGMMSMHRKMEQRVDMLEQLVEQVIKHMHQRAAEEH